LHSSTSITHVLLPCRKKAAAKLAAADTADLDDAAAAAAYAEEQQLRRRARKGSNPWASTQGWKSVDVNDELMLGGDEYGFAGLEILEDASLIDPGRFCVWGGGGGGRGVERECMQPQNEPGEREVKVLMLGRQL
jgi:ATP-dependent RNA helicase DDX24/MAK5